MKTSQNISVSLNFMPAFYYKHTGVKYGDAYYFDPRCRAEIELVENAFLYEVLGDIGVGSPSPSPSTNLFIQPIDLLKAAQGADIVCPPDATLETRGHVWGSLSIAEIAKINPHDAANHSFINTVLAQYREMQKLYGERADIFGMKSGTMNIHAPYTTAHQLCGEDIFYIMSDDPQGAKIIFGKIWDIYQAVFARIGKEIGAPPATRIYLGDCSASMLSTRLYREVVLPTNREIAAKFTSAGYHSCGPSTHLLNEFSDILGITSIELGAGTDLAQAVTAMPQVAMYPLVDPLAIRNASSDDVARMTRGMASACAPAPSTMLCAWSLDSETPIENVRVIYNTIDEIKRETI